MRLLGPPDESRQAAIKGGIPIEQDPCQHNIRNAPRCYNESVALQVPKMTITPVQGTVFETEEENAESKETRRLILKARVLLIVPVLSRVLSRAFEQVAGQIAALSIEKGAPDAAKQLRERADALNLPRIGCHQNAYCPAVQLNISPAQEHDPERASTTYKVIP